MRKGLVIAGVAVLVIGLVIGFMTWPSTTTITYDETVTIGTNYHYDDEALSDLKAGDKILVEFDCGDPEDVVYVFIMTKSKFDHSVATDTFYFRDTEIYVEGNSGTLEWECTTSGAYVLVLFCHLGAYPVPYTLELTITSVDPTLNYVGYGVAIVGVILLIVGIVMKAPPPPVPPPYPPVAAPPPPAAPPTVAPPPPGMKYCPKCGAVIPVGATFCPKCGAAQ